MRDDGVSAGCRVLLLLKVASQPVFGPPGQLTPYWRALAPTNEQVFGPDDPWESWVRRQLEDQVRK